MKRSLLITFISFFVILVGCNSANDVKTKPLIVTTTGIIADCITQIVGDQADVIAIMGPGVDPHLYKASQGDLSKLTKADIIVYNGLHLEGKMAEVLEKLGKTRMSLSVGSFADPSLLRKVDESSELRDPHIWFNPELWMACMKGIAVKLEEHEQIGDLDSAFNAFNEKVQLSTIKLNELLDERLSLKQRVLITSHDAFFYFGDAFQFKVRGLQGISTAAEYGVKDVSDLISFIVDLQVKAVFVETSVSDKNLKSVIEGAAAQGVDVSIGGTLYSDALGEASGKGGSYIGMIESNVKTIINGLSND